MISIFFCAEHTPERRAADTQLFRRKRSIANLHFENLHRDIAVDFAECAPLDTNAGVRRRTAKKHALFLHQFCRHRRANIR